MNQRIGEPVLNGEMVNRSSWGAWSRGRVKDNGGQMSAARGDEVYPELPPGRRRMQHRLDAGAASGDAAWIHRVAAAAGVDEPLAVELEEAALRGAPAGPGRPGPAQLLEWASDLSADRAGRERRLLKAAVHRVCAGRLGSAELWQRVEACPPSALRSCTLAGREVRERRRLEAEFHLDRAAAHGIGANGIAAAVAAGLRASLYLDAAMGGAAVAAASAGLAAVGDDRGLERWLVSLLADGHCYAEGPRSALGVLLGGGPAMQEARPTQNEPFTMLALGCYHVLSGQPREAIENLAELASQPDQAPEPDVLVRAHSWLALAHHLVGAPRQADDHAVSAVAASHEPGAHAGAVPSALASLLAARRGDWPAAEEHLRVARAQAGGSRQAVDTAMRDDVVLTHVAVAALAHARGELSPAHTARLAAHGAGDAARKYRCLWLALHVEALVESSSAQDPATPMAELRALAEQVPYLRVAACRLSGRLAERHRQPDAARRYYEAANDLPEECREVPFEVGLLEHSHGRLLTGLGDTERGSLLLSAARDRLAAAGAFPYAQRCAADLAAPQGAVDAGERSGQLTRRERAVAQLVAAGLTNLQVAARLYVSAKTVEYHLAQIYTKLGITSRRQLARYAELLAEPEQQRGDEPPSTS